MSLNKELYSAFCERNYVPIYSQPWWMDAVCGEDNWNVWLHQQGGETVASMPYYFEKRGEYHYITKAPLTQNNGILFKYPPGAGFIARQKFEEKIIDQACAFIRNSNLDVYEQQYHYTFENWLPFYWNSCTAITRYTYVIEDTSSIDKVWDGFSSGYRKNIKKALKAITIEEDLDPKRFYAEHAKVFSRQGLEVPFSETLWERLYHQASKHSSCKILYAKTEANEVASVLFLVWDEKSVYHLLGGTIPGFQSLESYNALTWEALKLASKMGLSYDFEGSMIKRISKSFRDFGAKPKRYFRIRKVFNPEIIKMEAEQEISKLLERNL